MCNGGKVEEEKNGICKKMEGTIPVYIHQVIAVSSIVLCRCEGLIGWPAPNRIAATATYLQGPTYIAQTVCASVQYAKELIS